MTQRSKYGDLEDLGDGKFSLSQSCKPRNYPAGGSWLPYNLDWHDDSFYGNLVDHTCIKTGTGDQSIAVVSPYGQPDDTITLGLPHVWEGGVLVPISTLEPQRNKNKLKWKGSKDIDLEQVNAGHYFKTTVEFLHSYVPEGNRIAFPIEPVPTTRLDRLTGRFINRASGTTMMRLRSPIMVDLDTISDPDSIVIPVPQEFETIDNVTYVVYTMPDYSAMTRPALDPTLELQPDASAGKDNFLREGTEIRNNGVHIDMRVGGDPSNKTLIQFDVSSIPTDAIIYTASFTQVGFIDPGATSDIGIHSSLVHWWEGNLSNENQDDTDGSTWKYRNGNTDGEIDWEGGVSSGGVAGDDYATTRTATMEDGLGTQVTEGLESDIRDWVETPANNEGWWLVQNGSSTTSWVGRSSDYSEAADRPELYVSFSLPINSRGKMISPFYGIRGTFK